ncbi:MAG: retron Ec67 family RNA-directed DNA polymerase/endonuclease [Parasphingorhabdus sp.]|nr:retron Ec67 family RNA-directed DNA polymerase/endonuclease [Parasphingorhabdus sp.]
MSKTKIQLLRECSSRADLAKLLGYKPKTLAYIVYQIPSDAKYKSFKLAKRSGGKRTIEAPIPELKLLQKRLSKLLQDALSDIDAEAGQTGSIHHGFRRKKSIITNAKNHRNRRFVFNLDLADFFHAINLGRILGFFQKNRNFCLNYEVALTIAQICCYKGRLPQGAPTSPIVSNLITHILDIRLAKLASIHGCTYSRYADDLSLSTSDRRFPRQIARKGLFSSEWHVGKKLKKEIVSSGFEINPLKTRMQYRQSRQDVTGLVVNQKVNTPSEYYREIRAMSHNFKNKGYYYHLRYERTSNGRIKKKKEDGTRDHIKGKFSHLHNVKSSQWSKQNPIPSELSAYEKDYRDLLLFVDFHFSEKPVILCEGKTDLIYLKAALQKKYKQYPNLIEKKQSRYIYKVRFVRYTATLKRLLSLTGGTSQLMEFLSRYKRTQGEFCDIKNQRPVICLIDNDSGAKGFLNWKDSKGKKINRKDDHFHLFGNVILILTPNPTGKNECKIEDYFSKKLLDTKLGTKKFNSENKGVSETEYGKTWFAERVIWPNRENVSFDKFLPLLDRLDAAAIKRF